MYSLLGCSQEWHISTVLLVGQRIHIWPTSQQETGPGNGSQSWYKGPLKKLPFSKARMLPWIPSSLLQLPVSPLWWAQNPSFQNLSPCLQDLGQLAHVSHSPGHLWNLAACLFGMLLPATLRGQRWELGGNTILPKANSRGTSATDTSVVGYTQQPHRTLCFLPKWYITPCRAKGTPQRFRHVCNNPVHQEQGVQADSYAIMPCTVGSRHLKAGTNSLPQLFPAFKWCHPACFHLFWALVHFPKGRIRWQRGRGD